MSCDEHESLITKMISMFEDSFSPEGEAPPRLTLDQAWTSRFVICHWKRSIEPCALSDLQPKEMEVLSKAICHSDCMDDQVTSALKAWPMHFVMTLLPDVTSLADGMDEHESQDALLDKAEAHEWQAKVAAFEAKLVIDQRSIRQVAAGMDILKDTLDWIQMQKQVKQASVAKEAVDAFMDERFPCISCEELVDLPGQIAATLNKNKPMQQTQKNPQLVILHVDFNVPNESQMTVLVTRFHFQHAHAILMMFKFDMVILFNNIMNDGIVWHCHVLAM